VSAWDELMAATYPGRVVETAGDEWLVLSRSYREDRDSLSRLDRITLEVELVRSGSPTDPRRPPDPPRPTNPEEARNGG
jgi:hypothetical protein